MTLEAHLARLAEGDESSNEALLELAAAGRLQFGHVDPTVVGLLGQRFVEFPMLLRMGIYFCLKALGERGSPALPGLLRALDDPRNDCRVQAAEMIAGMGEAAAVAVPELLEALQDEGREDAREWVAEALARAGADLSPLEDHPSPYVREGVRLARTKRSR